jgi:hypothetical protein
VIVYVPSLAGRRSGISYAARATRLLEWGGDSDVDMSRRALIAADGGSRSRLGRCIL